MPDNLCSLLSSDNSTTGQYENRRLCLCRCVQLEAQLRSQGISDFKLNWKSDIRHQDEINENPAAESHEDEEEDSETEDSGTQAHVLPPHSGFPLV